ncbi:M15 family metallopeptidase [Brevibacillus panacihumi]|nr:M15 family metallopeptidase [Brevibacillus panacihumi]
MERVWKQRGSALLLGAAVLLAMTGCSGQAASGEVIQSPPQETVTPPPAQEEQPPQTSEEQEGTDVKPSQEEEAGKPAEAAPQEQGTSEQEEIPAGLDLEVVAEPASMAVLVNKQHKLPESYEPPDLVFPNVPYLLPEKSERRKMRQEAATALEQMFAAAKADGIQLAGVSAYRPHAYQKDLFNRYVKKDGLEKARTYSAYPGTSEHETGLAIDISGIDGKCAASSCFAGTKEAIWLAENAADYGFIVRYPEGKEAITGYIYEPWHMRYVGVETSKAIVESGLTMEEYFGIAPVSSQNP